MVMAPLVSILMPVYKTAPYLREAMDSMLSQTFADFELIVLNDCSPDNAEELLDAYDDSRIVRYKGEKNVGLSNVLNVGIGMARGKYIARMDSDDISLPQRLQVQVDYLEKHPDVDLVSVGMRLFGAKEGTWIREINPEKVKIEALFHSPVLHASSVLPEVLYEYRIHEAQATVQTDKTTAKSREVQMAYLQEALPSLSDRNREAFPERLWPAFFANLRDGFFDKKLLAKRLYKMSRKRR